MSTTDSGRGEIVTGCRVRYYPPNEASREGWVVGLSPFDDDAGSCWVVGFDAGEYDGIEEAFLVPVPDTVTVTVELPRDEAESLAEDRGRVNDWLGGPTGEAVSRFAHAAHEVLR